MLLYTDEMDMKLWTETILLSEPSHKALSTNTHLNRRHSRHVAYQCLTALLLTLCITLALIVSLSAVFQESALPCEPMRPQSRNETNDASEIIQHCGRTAAEARKRGCNFDTIALHWVPPICQSHNTTYTMEAEDDILDLVGGSEAIQFWSMQDMAVINPRDMSLSKGNEMVWTTLAFHRAHCAYMRRLEIEARTKAREQHTPVYALQESISAVHNRHCNKVLLDRRGDLHNREKFVVTLGSCQRVHG